MNTAADAMLRELAPATGYDDDVAMVIYRHGQEPLRIESPAVADQLVNVRHRLSHWLRAADVPEEPVYDIVLVASEACTNCVEHAYRGDGAGTMSLEAHVVDGEIRVRITDAGSWKTPAVRPGNSGRGLVLMRALSDALDLHCTPTGTTVDFTFRLTAG